MKTSETQVERLELESKEEQAYRSKNCTAPFYFQLGPRLATLSDDELKRVTSPHDEPNQHFTVDGLLWHVLIHEMRHTAQIAVLLRSQGIKPPSLDLLFYLPAP